VLLARTSFAPLTLLLTPCRSNTRILIPSWGVIVACQSWAAITTQAKNSVLSVLLYREVDTRIKSEIAGLRTTVETAKVREYC